MSLERLERWRNEVEGAGRGEGRFRGFGEGQVEEVRKEREDVVD